MVGARRQRPDCNPFATITEELASKLAPGPAGVPAQEGLTAREVMMAQAGYQSPHDEFGWLKPNFLVEQLEEGARQREAEAKEWAVAMMQDDLGGKS